MESETGEDSFKALSDRLLAWMEDEKPCLDQDFFLENLVEQLQVPKHLPYYYSVT